MKLALWAEGGEFYSYSARRILSTRYGVEAGAYSYGGCFVPGVFPPSTTIGRYASIAQGVLVLRRNHPMDRISTHPFFFNSRLGYVAQDHAPYKPLWIGHDAWIGERAVITPGCQRIGIGAVVGAASVVTRDVPAFAIVAGSPARVIKFRFEAALRDAILKSEWWEQPVSKCVTMIGAFSTPLTENWTTHPLLRSGGDRRTQSEAEEPVPCITK
jgi:acetyltransferase-like isoleucine patch superfamily enzyme